MQQINSNQTAATNSKTSSKTSLLTKQKIQTALWSNNPALVQMLGLCPLLAVSNSVVNALGLGIASIFVLSLAAVLVSLCRKILRPEIRIAIFVLIIASAVNLCEIFSAAFAFGLYQSLGIYLPLIVTNCLIIARAESFAQKNPPLPALLDGFLMGLGFTGVLLLLAIMREITATGKVFANMQLLFGQGAENWEIEIFPAHYGNLLAALPAGAFIFFALIIAAKNALDDFFARKNS